MSAAAGMRPAGYAATAAAFLDEAAADGDGGDLAVRQLAALLGIGWAVLAPGDQLADASDALAGGGGKLEEIAAALTDLPGERPGRRGRGMLGWLRPEGGLR